MSDMTHSQAEDALAAGDEEDVAEALAAERAETEGWPEEAAMNSTEDGATRREGGRGGIWRCRG